MGELKLMTSVNFSFSYNGIEFFRCVFCLGVFWLCIVFFIHDEYGIGLIVLALKKPT